MQLKKIQTKLRQRFNNQVSVEYKNGCRVVSGKVNSWQEAVEACSLCAVKNSEIHVVNDLEVIGLTRPSTFFPSFSDTSLDQEKVDVLIIGGGISGASIARELSKWKLNILLVDKEADLALHASSRNDGEIHPGVDLNVGSLKQKYVLKGNQMYDQLCNDLDVSFKRCGQYVGFYGAKYYPLGLAFAWHRKHICKIIDTCIISKKKLLEVEPKIDPNIAFALYNPSAGCVSPYELTVAYGENAISNGARISLNTYVSSMEIQDHKIISVKTNKGVIFPQVVINAAGVFAEDIACMAQDRFYSIHPRRGTDCIFDTKKHDLVSAVISSKSFTQNSGHSKGGGVMKTVHNNLLIGPDAVETYEKENFATTPQSVDAVFNKQKKVIQELEKKDIITYFTGIRAATFEEDFILTKGRNTQNLIHCAGIQSPGLTTAPAVAIDIAQMSVDLLSQSQEVALNTQFNPIRKANPVLRTMTPEQRNSAILKNPDYGIIICRCEEISKGEILDALHSNLPVCTVDGIKKRLRPGMGRCQGSFCMPSIIQIIAEDQKIKAHEVLRTNEKSRINLHLTKGSENNENI